MSETFLEHHILNTLPQQYGPFKISYNTYKDNWSINELLTMCVQEEGRLLMLITQEKYHNRERNQSKNQANKKGKNKVLPKVTSRKKNLIVSSVKKRDT